MKKRSAFTLLELIIAVSIIAMMSLLFVMVMTHSFWSQHAVREQTQEVLNNQKQIESEIAELKSQMASGAPVNTVSIPAFKPGHSVNVVALQVGKGYDATFALVADYREPVIEVPKIADAKTTVSGFDVVHKGAPNITDKAGLRLSGSFTRKDHLTLVETYYWYASVPGFNIPVPDHLSDADIESSGRYPRFPEQYELIPVTSRKELELSSIPSTVDLAGRHVVMLVSPAGVTGKIGEPAVSRPVLITGLPIVDRLVLRLDGSFAIHQNDRTVTSVDLDRWTNLENKTTPVAQSGPTKPTHVSTDSGVSFIADRVQFKVGAGFRYAIPHISGKATAVFVAKGVVPESFFQIGARTSSGGINPQASFVESAETKMLSDGYTLYWKEVNLTGRADAVSIGDADVEVAEVLLFNKAFNATDRKALEDYLIAKYQPTIKGQPIDSIPDVAVEIKAKQNFVFP
ncbi:MAG: type II secretion system protein, partial [Bacillota bacterium]|nr:type II secretion system protein [Bacillota bacterium]